MLKLWTELDCAQNSVQIHQSSLTGFDEKRNTAVWVTSGGEVTVPLLTWHSLSVIHLSEVPHSSHPRTVSHELQEIDGQRFIHNNQILVPLLSTVI